MSLWTFGRFDFWTFRRRHPCLAALLPRCPVALLPSVAAPSGVERRAGFARRLCEFRGTPSPRHNLTRPGSGGENKGRSALPAGSSSPSPRPFSACSNRLDVSTFGRLDVSVLCHLWITPMAVRSSKTVPPSSPGTFQYPRRRRSKPSATSRRLLVGLSKSDARRLAQFRRERAHLLANPPSAESTRQFLDAVQQARIDGGQIDKDATALPFATWRRPSAVAETVCAGDGGAFAVPHKDRRSSARANLLDPGRDPAPPASNSRPGKRSGNSDTPPPESPSSSEVCLSCPHGMRVLIDYQPGLVLMTRFGDVLFRT